MSARPARRIERRRVEARRREFGSQILWQTGPESRRLRWCGGLVDGCLGGRPDSGRRNGSRFCRSGGRLRCHSRLRQGGCVCGRGIATQVQQRDVLDVAIGRGVGPAGRQAGFARQRVTAERQASIQPLVHRFIQLQFATKRHDAIERHVAAERRRIEGGIAAEPWIIEGGIVAELRCIERHIAVECRTTEQGIVAGFFFGFGLRFGRADRIAVQLGQIGRQHVGLPVAGFIEEAFELLAHVPFSGRMRYTGEVVAAGETVVLGHDRHVCRHVGIQRNLIEFCQ